MAPKGRAGAAVTPTWNWIASKPGIPEIGGGIAAIFKSEGCAPPAALKSLYPNDGEVALRASMFAREAIANSWDAYHLADREDPEFTIDCTFGTLKGADARSFRCAADLIGLAGRVGDGTGRAARSVLGLDPETLDCLHGDPGSDVAFLRFEERFGGGMGGAWETGDSALDRALMKVGWAQSLTGAGGSYGYGKAAVAQGSKINSIIVYTCFPEDDAERGVTRRLLGITYWRPHALGRKKFTGWATYGGTADNGVGGPLENAAADTVASMLGIPTRNPMDPCDLGTTVLVLDPAFGPEDLEAAVLVNWWPALLDDEDRRLRVRIGSDTGALANVDPDGVDLLRPFVETYLRDFDEEPEHHFGEPLVDETHGMLGELDLIAHGPTPAEGPKSLVALVRSHQMVIQYREWSGAPVVRGSFLADEAINEHLRQTEPPEHDRWLQKKVGDHKGEAIDYQIARSVAQRINDAVDVFRREIDPTPARRAGATEVFGEFFSAAGATTGRRGATNSGGRKEEGKTVRAARRMVHVHLVHPLDETDIDRPARGRGPTEDTLIARANARFGLMDWVQEDESEVEITIGARIAEDGPAGGDALEVAVLAPPGFVRTSPDGVLHRTFRGSLQRGRDIEFKAETAPYDSEWTVEMFFDAEPIIEAADA